MGGGSTPVREWTGIRWFELPDLILEAGEVEAIEDPEKPGNADYRQQARKRDRKAVKDIDIWKMDSLDVF